MSDAGLEEVTLNWLRILVLVCAVTESLWMAFDGSQALITGTLVTPHTGPYAGQLGPWRLVVESVGIDPRGTVMKAIFAAYGWTWLLVVIGFATGQPWSWWAMVVAAAGALWFLPMGTLLGTLQLIVLVAFRARLQ